MHVLYDYYTSYINMQKEANIFKTLAIGISEDKLKISVIRISAKSNEYSPSNYTYVCVYKHSVCYCMLYY